MSPSVDPEAILRAALREAADSIEPRADGLERIRARLARPQSPFLTWMQAVRTDVILPALAAMQDVLLRAAAVLRAAWGRLATPPPATGRHRSTGPGWLRPIAGASVAIAVIAVGVYVAIDATSTYFPSSSTGNPVSTGQARTGARSNGAGTANSGNSAPIVTPSATASPSCPPSITASKTSTPSPSDTDSPSPSDTTSGSDDSGGTDPADTTTPSPTTTPAVSDLTNSPTPCSAKKQDIATVSPLSNPTPAATPDPTPGTTGPAGRRDDHDGHGHGGHGHGNDGDSDD